MSTIRISAVIESDGELHVSNLPCRKGDRVEGVLVVPEHLTPQQREAARERFLSRARSSTFRSSGPYPSRDELHERH